MSLQADVSHYPVLTSHELLFLNVRQENVAKHSGNKLKDKKGKERKSRQ